MSRWCLFASPADFLTVRVLVVQASRPWTTAQTISVRCPELPCPGSSNGRCVLSAARKHQLAPSEAAAQRPPAKKARTQSAKEQIFYSMKGLYQKNSPVPDAASLRALFSGDAGLATTFAAQRGLPLDLRAWFMHLAGVDSITLLS